jgi:hypothetical protein
MCIRDSDDSESVRLRSKRARIPASPTRRPKCSVILRQVRTETAATSDDEVFAVPNSYTNSRRAAFVKAGGDVGEGISEFSRALYYSSTVSDLGGGAR